MADAVKDILGEYDGDPFASSPVPPRGKSSDYRPTQTPAQLGVEMMDTWAKPFPSWSQMATDAAHGVNNALAGDRGGKTTADLMNVWLGSVPAAMYGIPRGALGSGPARAPGGAPAASARKLDPLGFYSKAVEESERLPIGKKGWTGDQVLAALKKAGVKPEEIKWMDLEKALEDKPTWLKEEVVALAEDRRVKPQRHALDEDSGMSDDALRDLAWEDAHERARENIQIKPDEDMVQARIDELTVEPDPERPGTFRVIDDNLRADEPDRPDVVVSDGHKSHSEANAAVAKHAEEWAEEFLAIYDGDHKLAGYDEVGDQLARARTQRDKDRILSEYVSSAVEREMDDFDPSEYRRDIGESEGAKYKGYLDTRPGGEDAGRDYTELLYTVPRTTLSRKGIPDFTASHWDEPNIAGSILAHYYNDAATGKDVLFANELQSDWGQKLRKYGEKKPQEEVAALGEQAKRAAMRRESLADQYYELSDPTSDGGQFYRTGGYEPTVDKVRDLERAIAHLDRARGIAAEGRLPPDRYGGATWPEAIANAKARVDEAAAAVREAGIPLVPPDDPHLMAWQKEYGDAKLRETETENAFRSAQRGISPGPFVGSTSDFTRFLGKNALTEAAKSGAGYFAWSPADIVTGRWGEHLRPFYEKQVPETMLKLAREHDPEAQLTKAWIGDYEGTAPVKSYTVPHPEDAQALLPFGEGNGGLHIDRAMSRTVGVPRRPEEIVMQPRNKDTSQSFQTDANSLSQMIPMYGFDQGPGGVFRSRAAAEEALAGMQRAFDEPSARPDLTQMQKDYDLTEVPAIAITDKMRQSIKEKGFPLFVNPPQSSIPSFLSNPSPTTGQFLQNEYGDRPYDPRFDT